LTDGNGGMGTGREGYGGGEAVAARMRK